MDFILQTIKSINDINTKVVARGFRFSYNLDLLASVIWRHRSVREREKVDILKKLRNNW